MAHPVIHQKIPGVGHLKHGFAEAPEAVETPFFCHVFAGHSGLNLFGVSVSATSGSMPCSLRMLAKKLSVIRTTSQLAPYMSRAGWPTNRGAQRRNQSRARGVQIAGDCFCGFDVGRFCSLSISLSLPKMPSGANAFEISDIQESET